MAYNQNYGYQNSRGAPRRDDPPKALPDGYLKDGYFFPCEPQEKPVMRKEYILGYPRQIAGALNERNQNLNKSSQIRKYYDYCIRIRDLLQMGYSFPEVESEFCRISNFVAYAKSRSLVTQVFVDFIDRNIKAIHNGNDFYAFLKHFEAVVAHLK